MAYPIFDIDITNPLPTISVSDEDTGIAVLLRKHGRPIDFLIEAIPAHREFKLKQLTGRIEEIARTYLSEECIKDYQGPPLEHRRLPSLTIAIPTKDRPHHLGPCLESIEKMRLQSQSLASSIDVLVVDNGSKTSDTLKVVSSFSEVRYLWEPRPGISFARNLAIRKANSQLIAFLDDDTVLDHSWLEGLVDAWSQNPNAAAYLGLVLPYELAWEAQVIFEQRGGFRRGFRKITYGQTLPGDSLYPLNPWILGTGANMAFQIDVLRKLGGFDEALGVGTPTMGGEDLDIFYRVIRAGYSIQYEPNYLLFHKHRRTMKELRDQYWAWGVGVMAFAVKTFHADPTHRFRLGHLVLWWFAKKVQQWQKSLVRRQPPPPHMIWAQTWGGIQGLWGRYSRSQKCVERINSQLGQSAEKKS